MSDNKVLLKALRKLLQCPPATLSDAQTQLLSRGLCSAEVPVVELALAACRAHTATTAAAINTAWPRAPLILIPLMADAAVEAALHASDPSVLLRMVGSREDGGGPEISAAVGQAICAATTDTPAVWRDLRTFVATVLLHGSGHEIQRSDEDAYIRVELHEACIMAFTRHPECFCEVAALACCYSTCSTGQQWAATALRQVVRAQCTHPTAHILKAELCLLTAFELVPQGRSAVPALRLLNTLAPFPVCGARAEAPDGAIARLLFCAGHLLGVVKTVAERQLTLRWLRMAVSQGTLVPPPLRAYVTAIALREQRSSDTTDTVAEADSIVRALAGTHSNMATTPAADEAMLKRFRQGCLSTVAALARPLAIAQEFVATWASLGQPGTVEGATTAAAVGWIARSNRGGRSVADEPSRVTAAACTAALLLHPSAPVRQKIAAELQTRSSAGSNAPNMNWMQQLAMCYLPTVLHIATTETDGPVLASLLHLVPALAQQRIPAQSAFRFVRQLLSSGVMLDVCVILTAKLWCARVGASGSDDILAVLRSAISSAIDSKDPVHHVAAASALEMICHSSPSVGVGLVSLCVDLLQQAQGGGARAVALRCISMLCDARELACLPVIRLLRRMLPLGIDLHEIKDDRIGPPLVAILVCAVHDYRAAKEREQAVEEDGKDVQEEEEAATESTLWSSAAAREADSDEEAIAVMDWTVCLLWQCISTIDHRRNPATRAAAFNGFADLVDAGVEAAVALVDAAPSRDQAWHLLRLECNALQQSSISSVSGNSLAACESLAVSVLSHQRASCNRAAQVLAKPQPRNRSGGGDESKKKLRGRMGWYSKASADIAPTGLLWCYRPPPPKDKPPRGQPVPRRHLVARAQGYRETLSRLLLEIDTSCDSWVARQQLPGGWALYMERLYLAVVDSIAAQASIDGETLTSAEAARRAVAEVSTTLLASANSGVPHQAQNAALGIGGLIAADGGIGTLPLVDDLLAWVNGSADESEWLCIGASLALGHATRAIRVGHPVVAKRVANVLCDVLRVNGEASLVLQSAAAFSLGMLTTTDAGLLDSAAIPPPCDHELLQTVVTALFLACVDCIDGMSADFVDMRSNTCSCDFGPAQVKLVTKPHRGHAAALMALGFTLEEILRAGEKGRRLLMWLQSWACVRVQQGNDGDATPGMLCLLASSSVTCYNARLINESGARAALRSIEDFPAHNTETESATYVARAALVHGMAVGNVEGHAVASVSGTIGTLVKVLEPGSGAEPMARAATAIALAQFFGMVDSPTPPRSAAAVAMLASTADATWSLYASVADRLHMALLKDRDSRVRAMAGVAIGMSTQVDANIVDANAVDESSLLGLPIGLELGTALVAALSDSNDLANALHRTSPHQQQAVLRVLAQSAVLPRFSWGSAFQSLIRGGNFLLRACAVQTMLTRIVSMPTAESVDTVAKQLLSELLEPYSFEAMFATVANTGDALSHGGDCDKNLALGCTLLRWLPLLIRLFSPARGTQLIAMVAALGRDTCATVAIRAVVALTSVLQSFDINECDHDDTAEAEISAVTPAWNLSQATVVVTHEVVVGLAGTLPHVWQAQGRQEQGQLPLAYVDAVTHLVYSLPAGECQTALQSLIDNNSNAESAPLAAGLQHYLQHRNGVVADWLQSFQSTVRWCAGVVGGSIAESTVATALHRLCCSGPAALGATVAEQQQGIIILLDELVVLGGPKHVFGNGLLTMLGHAVQTAFKRLNSAGLQDDPAGDDGGAGGSSDATNACSELARLVGTDAWAIMRQPILQRLLALVKSTATTQGSGSCGSIDALLSTVLALRHTEEFATSVDRSVQLILAEAVWRATTGHAES